MYFDILFFVAISVALGIRIYPLMRIHIQNVDNYYHLLAARQIWCEKRLPDQLNAFLITGTYSYPPLLHIILSPLAGNPNAKREAIAQLIAPILDVLSAVIIYLLLGDIIGKPMALVSVILYSITPLLVIESLPITPRTLGALFLNLFMLIIILYAYSHNYWLIAASIACVPFILLSHKMATQTLVFISMPLSIIFLIFDPSISILIGISLAAGLALTLIASKGFYKKVLRGHKAMLSYHFRHGNYKGEKRYGNPIKIIQQWPWLVLMIPAIIISNSLEPLAGKVMLVPLFWGSILVILTVLWKYGDNYRYLVYAVAPLSLVFAAMITALPTIWALVFIVASISLSIIRLIIFFARRLKEEPIVTSDLLYCLEYINKQQEHSSFGCVPVLLNYPAAFLTNKSILGAEASPEPWEKGIDLSQFYRDESLLLELISNYKTRLYLVNMDDAAGSTFESLLKDSTKIRSDPVYSHGHYKIYELESGHNYSLANKTSESP